MAPLILSAWMYSMCTRRVSRYKPRTILEVDVLVHRVSPPRRPEFPLHGYCKVRRFHRTRIHSGSHPNATRDERESRAGPLCQLLLPPP